MDQTTVQPTQKPLTLRIEGHLKVRLMMQSKRLNCSQNALVKMAIVRLLEEEEKIEANNAKR